MCLILQVQLSHEMSAVRIITTTAGIVERQLKEDLITLGKQNLINV